MTSFLYRITAVSGAHVHVTVFAGPDEHHRAASGRLVFRRTEWYDFAEHVAGPNHTMEQAPEATAP